MRICDRLLLLLLFISSYGVWCTMIENFKPGLGNENNPKVYGLRSNGIFVYRKPTNALEGLKDISVLIVEDDTYSYHLTEIYLHKLGVRKIFRAHNGQQAITEYNNRKPDAVLMDIYMPILNGFETTRIIKKQNPQAKILAVTATATIEDKTKALEAGCDSYISKPVLEKVFNEHFLNLFKDYQSL